MAGRGRGGVPFGAYYLPRSSPEPERVSRTPRPYTGSTSSITGYLAAQQDTNIDNVKTPAESHPVLPKTGPNDQKECDRARISHSVQDANKKEQIRNWKLKEVTTDGVPTDNENGRFLTAFSIQNESLLDVDCPEDPLVEEFGKLLLGDVYSNMEYDYEDPASHPVPIPELLPFLPVVVVDHVKGPDNFFIKLNQNSDAKAFGVFQGKLSSWYDQTVAAMAKPDLRERDLVKGGHYVALCSLDCNWHRVILLDWTPHITVRVQLLDDGGIMSVPLKHLQHIRRVFCQAPMQALHASLQMVTSKPWTEAECAKFKKQVEGREFNAIIMRDKLDPEFLPFPTAEIVLVDLNKDLHKINDLDHRLKYEYTFANPKPSEK